MFPKPLILAMSLLSSAQLAASAVVTGIANAQWNDGAGALQIWAFYQNPAGGAVYYKTYNQTTNAIATAKVPYIKPAKGTALSANTAIDGHTGARQVSLFYSDATGSVYEEVYYFFSGEWSTGQTKYYP